ncbi:peptide/nickel transport system permease protein/nickel transport system permease protein [Anaerovirgula multivorans]|uniref:Nickel import system permease protein NikB n=1 Tax=Anaerovirgula multivorans TaxID=312168 RepID=A0A239IK02_9FIRM|nr:nickel/cobalt ABC transporter permease [Anaerovirgula multivorans]SNS93742.1 peptide/nickel transport system permease protein/nickel transport system permease protein [Anaerovirgula multivorans]
MRKFIFKRLISLVPILLGISIITFALLQLVPVDPAEVYLRLSQIPPTEEAIAVTRAELGLNDPLHQQYIQWVKNVFSLDFGKSFVTRNPVLEELLYYFPATIQLTLTSLVLVIIISIPMAILSALYKDTIVDNIGRCFAFLGASMPSFWVGLLLMYVFSLKFDLLPVAGRGSIKHLILPSFTLALGSVATYTRLLRTTLLENFKENYVLYGRTRGLKEGFILLRHVFKNAILPVITAFGMSMGYMLAGSVIVENVFAWPGVGRYIISAIFNRDYPVIQCYVLIMAVIFVLLNLLVDILYGILDPRIRIGGDE